MPILPPLQLTARELLELEQVATDCFRARGNLDNFNGVTFGGQALGQALMAAHRTGPGWPANSMSGWFLRGGRIDRPIEFKVERVHDGRRFATRRVSASQDGRAMFDMLCSFHDEEAGIAHQQVSAPAVPSPETLLTIQQLAAKFEDRLTPGLAAVFSQGFPIEIRLVDPESLIVPVGRAARDFWFRIPSADEIDDADAQQALLAFMSDYWLPGAIAAPHQRGRTLRSLASLNHSLWLHAPARTDDWLLYTTDSHWAAHGRGLSRGLIYDHAGALIATVMQEALISWV